MSLGDNELRIAALRARAHPLRLRMLSLLSGAAMSAAELARELGITQALASYHLRQLADAGVVQLAEERVRRGGRERRYRYRVEPMTADRAPAADDDERALFIEAVIEELRRRSAQWAPDLAGLAIDAELWVEPADWAAARSAIAEAGRMLHDRARRPHESGTVRLNMTVLLFPMLQASAEPAPQEP